MFWKKRPTVDAETEAWMIECWQWLDRTIPAHDDKTGGELILPSRTRFPETDKQGFERASYYFDLVRDYSGMREWPCKLVAQAASPDLGNSVVFGGGVAAPGPLGTFQATGNAAVITYDPAQLKEPMQAVATFVHELAHYLLVGRGDDPPGGEDTLECATDLATVHLGFGLFGANTAFNFRQFTDFDRQGWSYARAGYLSEAEWCFANALFLELQGIEKSVYSGYVKASVATQIEKNRAYLRANTDIVGSIRPT